MAGWMTVEPTLEYTTKVVSQVATKMALALVRDEFLEEQTYTVEVPSLYNPLPLKRALQDDMHAHGVEVEVDLYPVVEQSRWDLMVVCIGTMAPNPGDLVVH